MYFRIPQPDHKRRYDSKRAGSPHRKIYQTEEWRVLRKLRLKVEPFCRECAKRGVQTPASVVHHVVAHRGDRRLAFSFSHTASLCKKCHDGPAQQQEKLGYSTEIGPDGYPVDPRHPFFKGSKCD